MRKGDWRPNHSSQCGEKSKHATHADAMNQLGLGQRNRGNTNNKPNGKVSKLAVYRCAYCHYYHIGKEPRMRHQLSPYKRERYYD